MYAHTTIAQRVACRDLALEQNQRLFEKANALNQTARELLDRPDLDSEMFFNYLHLRDKANARFREALDHLLLINETFQGLASDPGATHAVAVPERVHTYVSNPRWHISNSARQGVVPKDRSPTLAWITDHSERC